VVSATGALDRVDLVDHKPAQPIEESGWPSADRYRDDKFVVFHADQRPGAHEIGWRKPARREGIDDGDPRPRLGQGYSREGTLGDKGRPGKAAPGMVPNFDSDYPTSAVVLSRLSRASGRGPSPADRRRLEAIVRDRNAQQKHVWRARIVLLGADGLGTNAIMRETGKSKTCVWRWQKRFAEEGVDGLPRDKTRPSRIPPLAPEIDRLLARIDAGESQSTPKRADRACR